VALRKLRADMLSGACPVNRGSSTSSPSIRS